MIRKLPLVIALAAPLATLVAVSANAQPKVNCTDPITQMEMTYCAELDWQAADKELNAAYATAMAAMRQTDSYLDGSMKGAADALKAAQRAWIPFRDNACASYGFLARGGTMEPMLIYQCRANLTRERTADLKELATGLGN